MVEDFKYPNREVIYEDNTIVVAETGRDYDFVATVVNKTDKKLRIKFTGDFECLEPINLNECDTEYDWSGFFGQDWWGSEYCPDISYRLAFENKEYEIFERCDLEYYKQLIKEEYSNEQIISSYLEAINNFNIKADDVIDAILNDQLFLSINNFGYEDLSDLLEV